jgi:hypothetical protein
MKSRPYHRTLKPEARAMLVAELERNLLRGEEAVGSDLILQELRHAIRAAGRPVARIDGAARLFFAPVEPFTPPATSARRVLHARHSNRSGNGSGATSFRWRQRRWARTSIAPCSSTIVPKPNK